MAVNPAKRGQEVNGFNCEVVVKMDDRLKASLERLVERSKHRSLASFARDLFAREIAREAEEGRGAAP